MQELPLRVVSTVVTWRIPVSTLQLRRGLFHISRPNHETVDSTYYKCGRPFSTTTRHGDNGHHAQAAKDLNQKGLDESYEKQEKEKQARTPWLRQGSDVPPVARPRSAGAMTKGE